MSHLAAFAFPWLQSSSFCFSIPRVAIRPSFSTVRCKTLNIFIKVCYSIPDVDAMTPRRLLASFSDVTPIPCRGRWSPSTFLTSLPQYSLASSSLTPLAATLMDLPASVANKRLTGQAKPFRCNTYKKAGGGVVTSGFPLYGVTNPAFHLPNDVAVWPRQNAFRGDTFGCPT